MARVAVARDRRGTNGDRAMVEAGLVPVNAPPPRWERHFSLGSRAASSVNGLPVAFAQPARSGVYAVVAALLWRFAFSRRGWPLGSRKDARTTCSTLRG
jgi:hypothetical protein